MSTITTINASDTLANSRAVINTNFSNLNSDKVEDLADLGLTESAANYNTAAQSTAFLVPTGAILPFLVQLTPRSLLLSAQPMESGTIPLHSTFQTFEEG
jgi:hypothetical protein